MERGASTAARTGDRFGERGPVHVEPGQDGGLSASGSSGTGKNTFCLCLASCYQPRNEALRQPEACLVSRNQALSESLRLLKNKLPGDTDILQEYFVPRAELLPFLDSMAAVLGDNDAKLLNASVRVIHREEIMLNYAREDMFSVVLYLNQEVSPEGNERMATLTADLIDTAIEHGGTFYLPYQLHYTRDQLERAYPEIGSFFSLKRRYDPDVLFRSRDPVARHEGVKPCEFGRVRPIYDLCHRAVRSHCDVLFGGMGELLYARLQVVEVADADGRVVDHFHKLMREPDVGEEAVCQL